VSGCIDIAWNSNDRQRAVVEGTAMDLRSASRHGL
jgi:hypothetical protein